MITYKHGKNNDVIQNNQWSLELIKECYNKTRIPFFNDLENIAAVSKDFGGYISGDPVARVLPSTSEECQQLIDFANNNKLKFTIRGRGFSQGGQTIAAKGAAILDCSAMINIAPPDLRNLTIKSQPGASWRSISDATIPFGLVPQVMPFFPELTIGGVVSVAGIGGNSHLYGCASGNVQELEVITGKGEIISCNNDHETQLFKSLLSGLGYCGLITSVTLNLRKFKQNVKTFYLMYLDHNAWINDQKYFTQRHCDYLEAFCFPTPLGLKFENAEWQPSTKWLYNIQVSFEYDENPPSESDLGDHSAEQIIDTCISDTPGFLKRYGVRAQNMKKSGSWDLYHPWWECLLPVEVFSNVLPELLKKIPIFSSDGLVYRSFILDNNCPPAFMKGGSDLAAGFAILPRGMDKIAFEKVIDVYYEIDEWLQNLGGKRFLSGWVGKSLNKDWQQHYGSYYRVWKDTKQKYDPNNIFQSLIFEKEFNKR